jgi:hypothetical protein
MKTRFKTFKKISTFAATEMINEVLFDDKQKVTQNKGLAGFIRLL